MGGGDGRGGRAIKASAVVVYVAEGVGGVWGKRQIAIQVLVGRGVSERVVVWVRERGRQERCCTACGHCQNRCGKKDGICIHAHVRVFQCDCVVDACECVSAMGRRRKPAGEREEDGEGVCVGGEGGGEAETGVSVRSRTHTTKIPAHAETHAPHQGFGALRVCV